MKKNKPPESATLFSFLNLCLLNCGVSIRKLLFLKINLI